MRDWREEKKQCLSVIKRVVVKVGSAVLTSPEGLHREHIENLVSQLAALHDRGLEIVLVSSGAVAVGRWILRDNPPITGLPGKQAAAAVGQSRLMHIYDQMFAARGKISAQVLLTREDLRSRRRFLNARNTFATLLSWRAIPVVNENDTVAVQELKFGDNDNLSGHLLNLIEADFFVNLTSAPGVFAEAPEKNPDAVLLRCIDDVQELDLATLCGGKSTLGSGGMYSKLLTARRAAQLGIATCIVPGLEENALLRALDGEELGTWVRPAQKSISSRKFWLAYNEEAVGILHIDEGAVAAVLTDGRSLLPAGITRVDGAFGQGALVRIVNPQGSTVAAGLCNYDAAELRRVMGKSLERATEETRDNVHTEAVHRDNMLIHAAF